MDKNLDNQNNKPIRYLRFLVNTLQVKQLKEDIGDEFTQKIFDYLKGESLFDEHVFCAFLYYLITECKRIQPAIDRTPNPIDLMRFGHFQNGIRKLFNSFSVNFTLDSVDPNPFRVQGVSLQEKLNHLLANDDSPHQEPRVAIILPKGKPGNIVPCVDLEFTLPPLSIEQKLDVIHFTICAVNYLSQKDDQLKRYQMAESSQKPESLKIISDFLISVRESVIQGVFREKEVWEDDSEFDESLPDIKRILIAQNQDPQIEKQWLDKNSPIFIQQIENEIKTETAEIEESDSLKYKFNLAHKVHAILYLLKASGVNTDAQGLQSEIARFIHAITNQNYKNIYDLVRAGGFDSEKTPGKHKEELRKVRDKFLKLRSNAEKAIQNDLERNKY